MSTAKASSRPGAAGELVVVVGGGIAGLVTALDLAIAGLRPLVLEATDRCGGVLSAHEVGGLTLDAGAESFATARPAVTDLLTELGLADQITAPNPVGAWVRHRTGAAPLPSMSLLGIPGRPLAADVRRVIGIPGVVRIAWDALLPNRSGLPPESSLGGVVRSRMGRRVLERLVEPVAGGVYATDPNTLDIQTVAPGISQALVDAGSLAGAVRLLRGGGERSGSAVATLTGGLHTLVEPLIDAVRAAGGEIRTGFKVEHLVPDDGTWRVDVATGETLRSRHVVIALPAPRVALLLAAAAPDVSISVLQAPITQVAIVTLVIDDHRLDAAPRGTGVLVAARAPGVSAKALTHATAKWPLLAEQAGPGRHVLRLSYGRGDGSDVPADGAITAIALSDAADLLGIPLSTAAVVDQAVVRWPSALPAPLPGHAAAVQAFRTDLDQHGLAVVGAAVAGSGLAAVVADARLTATRMAAYRLSGAKDVMGPAAEAGHGDPRKA